MLAGAFGRYRWAIHEVVRIASLPTNVSFSLKKNEKDINVATESRHVAATW